MITFGLVALECHRHLDFHGRIRLRLISMRGLTVFHHKVRLVKDVFKCLLGRTRPDGWTKAVQALLV